MVHAREVDGTERGSTLASFLPIPMARKEASSFLQKLDRAIAVDNGDSAAQMERVAAVSGLCDVLSTSLSSTQVQLIENILRSEIASIVNDPSALDVQLRTVGSTPIVEVLYSPTPEKKPLLPIFTLELHQSVDYCAQYLRALLRAALDTHVRSRLAQVTKGEKPTSFHFSVGVRPVADVPSTGTGDPK